VKKIAFFKGIVQTKDNNFYAVIEKENLNEEYKTVIIDFIKKMRKEKAIEKISMNREFRERF